jgi:hypothetical protein
MKKPSSKNPDDIDLRAEERHWRVQPKAKKDYYEVVVHVDADKHLAFVREIMTTKRENGIRFVSSRKKYKKRTAAPRGRGSLGLTG